MKNAFSVCLVLMYTFLLGLTSFTTNANAGDGPLVSNMDVFTLTVNGEGKEEVKPAETVEPGGVLEYRVVYTNQGDLDLSGLVVTTPIPQNTTFLGGSQKTKVSAKFLASLDGQTFESEPIKRKQKNAKGEIVEVVILPEKYQMIRWVPNDEIGAEESMVFTYRVKVD